MKNDTQKPDSPRPLKGGEEPLDPASCSLLLVEITREELLALIRVTLKAKEANRASGNDVEADNLAARSLVLVQALLDSKENV